MFDLILLWISQLSAVWGLAEGASLEAWFVPNLAASMALALCWTRFKHRAALLEQLAVASLAFNVVTTILDKDDPWQNVQPALVTLPLLLAVDFNEVNKGSPGGHQ